MLFTVQLDRQEALLYLLFEHQSTTDHFLVYRQLKYQVRIWDKWLEEHPRARSLPAIVPILLCHTPEGWSAPTSFEALFDLDAPTLALVQEFVPRFRVLVDDLSLQTDAELRGRAMTALGRVVLWCLKSARDTDEWMAGFVAWASLLRAVHQAPNGPAALSLVWRYFLRVHEAPEQVIVPALEMILKEEQKETMASIADQLIEKGMKKGLEQGGELHVRHVVLRLLQRRFGELPAEARARVEGAKLPELETWADRVLTAATLADVLEGAPQAAE